MYNHFPSLAEAFLSFFDISYAASPKQREMVERVRYQVYCEEFGYEPAENFPDLREKDRYDAHSLHCIISHRSTGRAAGCVRIICASEDNSLPIEDFCRNSLHLDYIETLGGDRNDICEFSRLAVDRAFRRRPGECHTRIGEFDAVDCSHQEQRTFSLVGIAAFLSAFAMAELTGRNQLFAMMEPNLPRLLRRAGILVQEAGEPVEYHGNRAPYFITTGLALANMQDDLHVLYDAIQEAVASTLYAPKAALG